MKNETQNSRELAVHLLALATSMVADRRKVEGLVYALMGVAVLSRESGDVEEANQLVQDVMKAFPREKP